MISIRNAKHAKTGLSDMIKYIGDVSEMTIVEIGSYVGDSTRIFAERFKGVVAVDPWLNGYDKDDAASYQHDMKIVEAQFDDLCRELPNIEKMKMTSAEAAKNFVDGTIDVVYIDALHTYHGVKVDIELWEPKIKKGGFLCGHDYQGRFQGVINAVNEFKKPDMTFKDTSWIIKK